MKKKDSVSKEEIQEIRAEILEIVAKSRAANCDVSIRSVRNLVRVISGEDGGGADASDLQLMLFDIRGVIARYPTVSDPRCGSMLERCAKQWGFDLEDGIQDWAYGLPTRVMPNVLFHFTEARNLGKILRGGIKPWSKVDNPNSSDAFQAALADGNIDMRLYFQHSGNRLWMTEIPFNRKIQIPRYNEYYWRIRINPPITSVMRHVNQYGVYTTEDLISTESIVSFKKVGIGHENDIEIPLDRMTEVIDQFP